jgi:hypothetical protein
VTEPMVTPEGPHTELFELHVEGITAEQSVELLDYIIDWTNERGLVLSGGCHPVDLEAEDEEDTAAAS